MRPVVDIIENVCGYVSKTVTAALQKVDSNIQMVRYDYGHWVEISSRLQDMSKHSAERYNKFPLIYLVEDITVAHSGDYPTANLLVYIMHHSNNTFTSKERQKRIFEPILYPIRDAFISGLNKSNDIVTPPNGKFDMNVTDLKYLGRNGLYGNTGNMVNEYCDAIEIRNLSLTFFDNNC